ncbi:hypothetical protein BS50DRAFT_636287 [Corynespora cassiicola Philippines]|uniref:Uncharacterized protein n=1 Tax=Corynespora cassiicola Philippines TaxID=1448308 RepID=A0A2T2NJB1_CORCC|nr:hypothetical protein BS50DRAFT_636287 [Corynespora cassiicola Philippines]
MALVLWAFYEMMDIRHGTGTPDVYVVGKGDGIRNLAVLIIIWLVALAIYGKLAEIIVCAARNWDGLVREKIFDQEMEDAPRSVPTIKKALQLETLQTSSDTKERISLSVTMPLIMVSTIHHQPWEGILRHDVIRFMLFAQMAGARLTFILIVAAIVAVWSMPLVTRIPGFWQFWFAIG